MSLVSGFLELGKIMFSQSSIRSVGIIGMGFPDSPRDGIAYFLIDNKRGGRVHAESSAKAMLIFDGFLCDSKGATAPRPMLLTHSFEAKHLRFFSFGVAQKGSPALAERVRAAILRPSASG